MANVIFRLVQSTSWKRLLLSILTFLVNNVDSLSGIVAVYKLKSLRDRRSCSLMATVHQMRNEPHGNHVTARSLALDLRLRQMDAAKLPILAG